jgi:choline dehydrogenase-like flavoprotein
VASINHQNFDIVIVGTGFASSFFLKEYLRYAPLHHRILVLERGQINDKSPGIAYRNHKGISFEREYHNLAPDKHWVQRLAFGGGTCWTGSTPRMHPNDFQTKSLYGVGEDWPFGYEELEPYYLDVEQTMGISGGEEGPYPRSKPYPLPPHRLNALDREFARKYPGQHIPMPSARASSSDAGRAVCCVNGVCGTCPIGAKFQIDFHMRDIYFDPRVSLIMGANVKRLEIANNNVSGVHYVHKGEENFVNCDLTAVGAHGIMSPFIMLKSGLQDQSLGRYLNEQVSIGVDVLLEGIKNYDGSQIMTGLGVMKLDGDFRKSRPGFVLENWNLPWLRAERGRWREKGYFKLIFEELPLETNYVSISSADPEKPSVYYGNHSDYVNKALADAQNIVEELLSGMPVESFHLQEKSDLGGEAHIQGTTRMGTDPGTSVVDSNQIHHKVRNLVVLGSGVFPTCPAANPTLTLSALSVRAARRLLN